MSRRRIEEGCTAPAPASRQQAQRWPQVMAIAQLIRKDFDGGKSLSGIGGVETGRDAAEFLLLGADTVQVAQWCSVCRPRCMPAGSKAWLGACHSTRDWWVTCSEQGASVGAGVHGRHAALIQPGEGAVRRPPGNDRPLATLPWCLLPCFPHPGYHRQRYIC